MEQRNGDAVCCHVEFVSATRPQANASARRCVYIDTEEQSRVTVVDMLNRR